jgi:hypothetical protein
MHWTFLGVLWILFFLDSIGAIVAKLSGKLSTWYSVTFPSVAAQFPVTNSWVWMYFVLAGLGLLTVTTHIPCHDKRNED